MTCAAVCIIPVLAAWAIIYYFAPVEFHDPTNAICIVIIGECHYHYFIVIQSEASVTTLLWSTGKKEFLI